MMGTAVESTAREADFAVAPEADVDDVCQRLVIYFRHLGYRDAAQIDTLVGECLQKARRKVAHGSRDELIRRALEEAQRRFESTIASVLALNGSKDMRSVAAASAALLLGGVEGLDITGLLQSEDPSEWLQRLRAALPRPVPPEAHLSMHEQPIRFFFSRSTHRP